MGINFSQEPRSWLAAITRELSERYAHGLVQAMSTKPQPERFRTRTEYRWARKLWKRKDGGSLIGNVALAGGIVGSQFAVVAFIALAVMVTLGWRSRP